MDFCTARFNMVHQQVRPVGVFNPKILDLLESTPREHFVLDEYRSFSYSDTPVPMGFDQVMLPPKIVGLLLQHINLTSSDSVLEIGTGTGYVTYLLAKLSKKVVSLEIIPELSEKAHTFLKPFNLPNIQLKVGNGIYGELDQAPFDVIVFTGSLPSLPMNLREQTNINGKIFCVLGQAPTMSAMLLTRINKEVWTETSLFETVIPPLMGLPQPEEFVF